MYTDDLTNTQWLGEVVDVNDPDKEGKIRVKVFGKFDDLSVDDIPWARPMNMMTSGSKSGAGGLSVPKLNSLVEIEFDNGVIYTPKWKCVHKLSDELIGKLQSDGYYENAKILEYDSELNFFIYYIKNDKEGFVIRTKSDNNESNQIVILENNTIQLKNAKSVEVTITDDNILLKLKGGRIIEINQDNISLGSASKSAEPCVLGKKNTKLHQNVITQLEKTLDAQIQYCTTQIAVIGNVPFFAPLLGGYQVMQTQLILVKSMLATLKNIDAPNTESKNVTLD
jgi:hypothetical protein